MHRLIHQGHGKGFKSHKSSNKIRIHHMELHNMAIIMLGSSYGI
jgi:hypothetical protein